MGNKSSSASPAKKRKNSLFGRKKKNESDHNDESKQDDYDWILECIVEYIESPECSIFVDGFIDENCLVFDANNCQQDSTTFEYKQIHLQYKQMIEKLLFCRLSKLGLSAQQFTDACHKASKTKLNSNIIQYIVAIDDFKVFQNVMIQRNIELEKEAIKYLSEQNKQNTAQQQQDKNTSNMTEEEQLAWALSESMAIQQPQSHTIHPMPTHEQQQQQLIPSAPSLSQQTSQNNIPYPAADSNMNYNDDPFQKIANIDMKPNRVSLKPLKLQKTQKTELQPLQSDDELPTLTAASIQNIKRIQSFEPNASVLKQKQMILDMRKRKRDKEMEILEPGSPKWNINLNKLDTTNTSTLPPLHKSLFSKMVEGDNDESNADFTLQ